MNKIFNFSKSGSSSGSGSSSSRSHSHSRKQGPSPQEALHRLRETEEMLTKKQEFLENRIQRELETARRSGTKNKRVALQALKRKKRLEKQLAQIDGTLSTIEFQREALENANTNTEVLKSMGYAAKAIKAVHEHIDLDKIDMMMQDITEQQEIAQEISDAISHPAAFGSEFDEDELLAELEELEEEELSKKMTKVMPKVPTTSLPSRQVKSKKTTREEDAGMKHLKAWAL
ncbi:charged multivesicular body protein 4b-like [Chiloscyllium plagiosum]|uniref:charged multivesicular body protein 4b-like n=1 Tax=Chiloscyllium plagiosum TaxID=36176 RepID=UPI001CB82FC4|nr:charged multivesicular body protein 4b-like [Chiloscyllium plagiosum]XP_060679612.1 charged multivesicular body protein 4b-like [Hemiscyllium ocellatum]